MNGVPWALMWVADHAPLAVTVRVPPPIVSPLAIAAPSKVPASYFIIFALGWRRRAATVPIRLS